MTDLAPILVADINEGLRVLTWSGLTAGQAGIAAGNQPAPFPWQSLTVQAGGQFGSGGSVQLESSVDGVNFFPMSPAALTSAGFFGPLNSQERALYVRPHVTAGDGSTLLTVIACFRS